MADIRPLAIDDADSIIRTFHLTIKDDIPPGGVNGVYKNNGISEDKETNGVSVVSEPIEANGA